MKHITVREKEVKRHIRGLRKMMQQISGYTQSYNQNVALLCKHVGHRCIIRLKEGESFVNWIRESVVGGEGHRGME